MELDSHDDKLAAWLSSRNMDMLHFLRELRNKEFLRVVQEQLQNEANEAEPTRRRSVPPRMAALTLPEDVTLELPPVTMDADHLQVGACSMKVLSPFSAFQKVAMELTPQNLKYL